LNGVLACAGGLRGILCCQTPSQSVRHECQQFRAEFSYCWLDNAKLGASDWRIAGSSDKVLNEHEMLMTLRVIVDAADDGKAKLLIETGRLKIMGFEHNLPATSGFGLGFDSAHEPCPLSSPTHVFRNKQVADVAGSAPRPSKDSRNRRAIRCSGKQAEEFSIREAGCADIKLVETFPQKPHVPRRRLALHHQVRLRMRRVRFHGAAILPGLSNR
jgi:hypothetical protein